MSGQEPHSQPVNLIDLTSDTESIPLPSQTVDLTLPDDFGSHSNASLGSNLDVDSKTPSLTSGCSQKEGSKVSPNTQVNDGNSSADDGMTLSSILAQSRKRRLGSDRLTNPEPEPDESSLSLTKEALKSFLGSHSLKPNSNFWSIHKPVSTQPILTLGQLKHSPEDRDSEATIDRNKQPGGRVSSKSRGHTTKGAEPAKTSDTNVHTKGRHTHKRLRLEGPRGAPTDTAVDTVHTVRGNVVSRARPSSSAFDDSASKTDWRSRQPRTTQGRPRPSLPASGGSSARRRRKPSEDSRRTSVSRQQPSRRRGIDTASGPQQLRVSVEPTEDHWDTSQRRREPSLVEDIHHTLDRPRETAEQQQQLDDLFDSDASAHVFPNVGDSMVRQISGGHGRQYDQQQQQQQQGWPRSRPQPKPSSIKLTTNPNPTRPEPSRPYASRNETFADAAASFNLLRSKYEKKRATTILDSVPADFGMPSRESRMRAVHRANKSGRNPRRSAKEAERKRNRHRERALARKREELEVQLAHQPEADREAAISGELDKCRRRYAENDRRRKAQSQNYLTVEYLEEGAGAGASVDDADVDPYGGGPATRPAGVIPASQALGPNETIVTYAVYISEPYDQDEGYEDHMQRTAEAFLVKDEANAFALKLLTDSSQGLLGVRYDADANGLLVGHKRLPSGKIVSCMVQREVQVYGLLDISNKWVREEVKDLYRPRFDVFYINIIPKVFREKEEEDKKKKKDQEAEAEKKSGAGEVQGHARGSEESPGKGLMDDVGDGDGDGDGHSLFSTPTPEPETAQQANEKHPSQGGGDMDNDDSDKDDNNDNDDGNGSDDDRASIASDATLAPSRPGGALGNLSWTDVEFSTIHAASYTDLRLANEAAFEVARLIWKPRTARHYAWEHYHYAVLPSIREGMREVGLDADRAEIEFVVPDVDGLVDHRPWLFIYSRVFVVEAKLEGPRDIGCDFVVVDGEDE